MIATLVRNKKYMMGCDTCRETEIFEGAFFQCLDQAERFGWELKNRSEGVYDCMCPSCMHKSGKSKYKVTRPSDEIE